MAAALNNAAKLKLLRGELDAAEALLYAAMSRGLSFKTTMGNVLTWTPPLITTQAQMDQALDILAQCLQEVSVP